MTMKPTQTQFTAYARAYDYFNEALFGDTLPGCLLNFSRKDKRVRGFYSPDRWESGESKSDEISLNPDLLKRPLKEVMSTLVHEMVHLWQYDFGTPGRAGYHNREWGDKMEVIGLVPSNTGQPGGKRTGQQMTHVIVPGGPFDKAFSEMHDSCKLPWVSGSQVVANKATKVVSKIKYTCNGCGQNAWGKPALLVMCATCTDDSGENMMMKSETLGKGQTSGPIEPQI